MNATDSIRVKVPTLRPLSTAHELRDATVRDYKRAAERSGVKFDVATLERLAITDLDMGDRYRADVSRTARKAQRARPPVERMTVEGEAAKVGGSAIVPGTVRRSPISALHSRNADGDRWEYAKGRVARIMAGASQHANRVVAYSTCEMPHLAYALFRVYANVAIRKRMPRPGDEPNPYFGLSKRDVNRLLQRQVEDICDLSTGRLGPWLVPK